MAAALDGTNIGHDGFSLHHLRDDRDLRIFRGRRRGDDAPVLVVMPATTEPSKPSLVRLQASFGLRYRLDAEWSTRPIDLFDHGGRPWLVLHDPGGVPLDTLVGRPPELATFLRIAIGIATSLAAFHAAGLTHRDIKPGNILVEPRSGRAWLAGFGLASKIPRQRQERESLDVIAGTLAYMAPEQTGRMNRSLDSRADLYAYGVTLYQLLTGELPFAASEPSEWVHCHIAKPPRRPDERVASIPAVLSDIILKLLAKGAEDRYQTASGVAVDLARCLAELDGPHGLRAFPLAAHDVPDRLLVPEKLYGREREVAQLLQTFDRVVASSPELVLVSGYSGVGKSAVVNELHKALVPPNGLFATGKFDQFKRDIPYSTLAEALQGLVRMVLGSSETELARWRQRIAEAVGPNGQLIVALIPELEIIVGAQPPIPALPPQDEQTRFQMVFTGFLGVFARREHPLALFLDDLQWIDSATLKLLADIIIRQELGHLMVIGAYRDNEVLASHPLTAAIESIRSAGASVESIVLQPLSLDVVTQLVADALQSDVRRAGLLAQIVHEKTAGNPFFTIQFLLALAEDGVLAFDIASHSWEWEEARLREMPHTDNVVALMAERLGRLPAPTLRSLQQLACVGNAAPAEVLALVNGCSDVELHETHWEAVRSGVIVRTGDTYSFLHDRVQEAAYSLMPVEERVPAHLRIGRLLLHELPVEPSAEQLFAVLSHLNRALELIDDPAEQAMLARLNEDAGRKALSSVAYDGARDYVSRAVSLRPEDAWTRDYEGTFRVYLLLSECEFLAKNFEAADKLFDTLLDRARSHIDRANVYVLRLRLYPVSGRYDAGVGVAIEALRLFDVIIPETEQEIAAATTTEFEKVPTLLAGRTIASLVDAPIVEDPVLHAIIALLVDAAPPTFIARPSLFPLVTLLAVNLSLRHGNTEQSAFAYASYALMLVSMKGDIETASQFSEMTLRLNDKLDNRRLSGALLHMNGDFIHFWKHPFHESIEVLERAFARCVDVGDLIYSAFVAFLRIWQFVEKGESLEEVLKLTRPYASFVGHGRNRVVQEVIGFEQRFLLALMGRTKTAGGFGSDDFDEGAAVKVLSDAGFGSGLAFHQILKQILTYQDGRYEESLQAAKAAELNLAGMMALPPEATHYFFQGLALLAVFDSASDSEKVEYAATLSTIIEKHARWRKHGPANYAHRHLLLLAEMARVEGRVADAIRDYEAAIRAARASGAVPFEAISHELAGAFHASQHFDTVAATHLQRARAVYARWGAAAKVRQLERRYPQWLDDETARGDSTIGARVESLDLATVLEVSRAVSGERLLTSLVEKLMMLAVEHAGALRALLLLADGGSLAIEAEAVTNATGIEVRTLHSMPSAEHLPMSVLNYVIRTRSSVVLDDAAGSSEPTADEYLLRERSRSVLCLPLLNQDRLVGALYVENPLASHVFTGARSAVLTLLASQAAISIENARLYEKLRTAHQYMEQAEGLSQTGSLSWKPSTGEIFWSEEVYRILGEDRMIAPSAALARRRIHADDVSFVESALLAAARDGTAISLDFRLRTAAGSIKYVSLLARPRGDVPADDREFVGAIKDITDRRRAEEALHDSQAALTHVTRVATLGAMSAAIAHEVSQPIAASSLNSSACVRWLRATPPNLAEATLAADRARADAVRAGEVITRLRALFKKSPNEREPFEIHSAIGEALELTAPETRKHGVLVSTDFDDATPLVLGDRVQLQQVVVNLVLNAVEAMATVVGPPRRLVVRTRQAAARFGIEVTDSGPGIPPDDKERVFDAFHTTKDKGMGIGLAISRTIVEAHDGWLDVRANDGPGATFFFTVPTAPPRQ